MEVRCAAVLTLTTCALAWPARAETESIALDYRVYKGCPDRTRFVEEVRALTTKAELVEADAALRQFRVETERKGATVKGRLTIVKDGESSEREVSGESCAEVVSALALATAIAVDPTVLGGKAPPKEEPKPEPPPPQPKPEPPKPKPEEDRRPPRPQQQPQSSKAVFSMGGGVMGAVAPDLATRFALRVGFKPAFDLAPEAFLEGGAILPVETASATFSAFMARAGATWEFLELGSVALGVFTSAELGVVNAVGADTIRRPLTEDRPWGAVDFGLSLRAPATSALFVRAEVGGFATLYRHEYLITTPANTPAEVHTIDDFGLRASGFVGFFL